MPLPLLLSACCCGCCAGVVVAVVAAAATAVVVVVVGRDDGNPADPAAAAAAAAASALPPRSKRIAATAAAVVVEVVVVAALLPCALRRLVVLTLSLHGDVSMYDTVAAAAAAGLLADSNSSCRTVHRPCLVSLAKVWDEHGSASSKTATCNRGPRMVPTAAVTSAPK